MTRFWDCSRCESTTSTPPGQVGTPTHICGGAMGMTLPYAPMGKRSDVRMVKREDYVRTDDVQRDAEGRVWSAAVVTTDEAEHVAVYAPTAHLRSRA